MAKRNFLIPLLLLGACASSTAWTATQKPESDITVFHVTVDMVQLEVAVTDKKGNYVTGLGPQSFAIYEDGIPQKIAIFGVENEPPRILQDLGTGMDEAVPREGSPRTPGARGDGAPLGPLRERSSDRLSSLVAGASVFILFDTSNYMYRGFVFAQDAISTFVRSLDHPNRVALYAYSRNFSRVSPLTPDRFQVLNGVRRTVAGDDAALYNSLLLTLKDAAQLSGRRVVVVFSNGPDNASTVSPEDVRELAQAEGIPIYMISTQEAKLDPLSTAIFERVSASTGGKAYFAGGWKDQQDAFASIRDDLAHLYTLSYYPQPNPNRGWRSITVDLVGENTKNYRVRTRSGYRPKAARATTQVTPSSPPADSDEGDH
jgi:VWFA-related protein